MKKPAFTAQERRDWYISEIEIAKRKFIRAFDKTLFAKSAKCFVEYLAKLCR